MKKFSITIQGKQFHVAVEKSTEHVEVTVNGKKFSLNNARDAKTGSIKNHSNPNTDTEQVLVAPMTGTVANILTTEGQKIKKGTTILVLLAMKMHNEIQIEHDGIIEAVLVQEGMVVEKGTALCLYQVDKKTKI